MLPGPGRGRRRTCLIDRIHELLEAESAAQRSAEGRQWLSVPWRQRPTGVSERERHLHAKIQLREVRGREACYIKRQEEDAGVGSDGEGRPRHKE